MNILKPRMVNALLVYQDQHIKSVLSLKLKRIPYA